MTEEQERYIKSRWSEMSCESLRKQFNEVFGTSYKTTAFHYHTKRLGLQKHIEHKYTSDQDAFLRDNSSKMTRKELVDSFNKRYGTSIKENAIVQRCFLRGWKAGSDGKFKVGGVPWGKTKGGREEYLKALRASASKCYHFERGHVPHNTLPVGAVRLWSDELMIKTDDGWKVWLRHLWEQEHGKIPEGYVVISVDGDRDTKDVSKLRMISNRTLTTLMANNWVGEGEGIVDTGIVWCTLKELLNAEDDED